MIRDSIDYSSFNMEKGNFEFWDWLKRTGKLRRSFLKTSIAVDTDKK
jgi:hypothetical protein